MRQFFEEEIVIPSGPYQGEPWSADRQPVQGLLLDLFDSGEFTEHITAGPSQTGKSLLGYVGPIAYHAAELRETVVLGLPGGGMVSDKWQDISTILEASPSLSRLIPTTGPGSKGGQIRNSVTLSNNVKLRLMTTLGRNTGRAGYTSRIVAVTEFHEFSLVGKHNTESDPYRQIQARQKAYQPEHRRTYAEGTVTIEGHYPWAARVGAAVALVVMPCFHCSEFIQFERENLKGWEDAPDAEAAGDAAYLECDRCKAHITEDQRREMIRNARVIFEGQEIDSDGNVTGERARSKRLWFRYNAAHSLLTTIGDIAQDEWQAAQYPADSKQRQEAERQLCQQVWTIPIKVEQMAADQPEVEEIAKRKMTTGRGILPEGCKYIATGVDVGVRKLHVVTLAVTKDDQLLCVEHTIRETDYIGQGTGIDGPTAVRLALRELRDELLSDGSGYLEMGTGRLVRPNRLLVDNSWETETIRGWCAETDEEVKDRVFVVRGKGTNSDNGRYRCPMTPGRYTIKIADDQSFFIVLAGEGTMVPEVNLNVDTYKLRVQAAATAPIDSPGALLLHDAPAKEHAGYCRSLFAEKEITEFRPGGRMVRRLVNPTGKSNHFLDATAYALCGLIDAGWDFEAAQMAAVEHAAAAKTMSETKEDGKLQPDEREYIETRQQPAPTVQPSQPTREPQPQPQAESDVWDWPGQTTRTNDPLAHLWD